MDEDGARIVDGGWDVTHLFSQNGRDLSLGVS